MSNADLSSLLRKEIIGGGECIWIDGLLESPSLAAPLEGCWENYPNHVNEQLSSGTGISLREDCEQKLWSGWQPQAVIITSDDTTQGLIAQIINSVASSQGWSGANTTEPPRLWENHSVLSDEVLSRPSVVTAESERWVPVRPRENFTCAWRSHQSLDVGSTEMGPNPGSITHELGVLGVALNPSLGSFSRKWTEQNLHPNWGVGWI